MQEYDKPSGTKTTCPGSKDIGISRATIEEADRLSKDASILGLKSEGVVTPVGLRAWSRRVRADPRGRNGSGLLGWGRKALSAYTWCRSDKGPQNGWLFKTGKADSDRCRCGAVMTGTQVVEKCPELDQWRSRRAEWREWREASGGRARSEEEVDAFENFFTTCTLANSFIPVLLLRLLPLFLLTSYCMTRTARGLPYPSPAITRSVQCGQQTNNK